MTEAISSKYIRSAKGNHPICEGEKGSLSLPTVSSYIAALAVHLGHNSHPNNHLPGKGVTVKTQQQRGGFLLELICMLSTC